jgi:hypothetical protein
MIMSRPQRKMLVSKTRVEVRNVKLPRGETLELTIQPGFYDKVRKHFGLAPDEKIDDDHLRMFVYGAFKGAIDKVEQQEVGSVGKTSTS